jgi:predicted anti-sigma-YlaC factor YlaD
MFTRHLSRQLAAYIDGEFAQRKTQQAELHLKQCARCRAECEQVGLGMAMVERLPTVEAPTAIWSSIAAALQEDRSPRAWTVHRWRLAFAATVVLVMAAGAYWGLAHRSESEWIETDSVSRVTLKIGEIGSVELAPNTRVRVVTERPDEHRLALARGEIRAKISAPPRLFFVDTASGTAVDLGCEYTLNTDEDGAGMLRVTKGWVSFQWKGLESLVPADASCQTRPGIGPGIPYFDDAPESVKQALESFGFEKAGNGALSVILADSRVRDTLTLWHLLSRVDAGDRALVYDRIAALTPVPAGVSREQALKLDPETLKRWKEELAWTW